MFGFAFLVLPSLISLVSSAYVAPRSERYEITTYAPSPSSQKAYPFPNATSIQQCQVAVTSWFTTTLTVTSSSADASSGSTSSATTSNTSNNRRLAMKRSSMSTTAPTSTGPSSRSSSSSTTTINTISLLSEFASIYSALSQYEYNATANSSTVTVGSSFNISAYSTATGTVYSNSSGANATSIPTACAPSCTACTTVFYIATTTITTTSPPTPITTLPPITIGTNTYTATGTYYVIDNSTLSPGGFAILVSNSTLLSLGPSGTQLVIAPLSPTAGGPGPSTYDLSPSPAASPPHTTPASTSIPTSAVSKAAKVEIALTTIAGPYNLPVVVFPSQAIVIAGTTINPGSSAVTIRETPVSLAPSSAFLVVGSSTISLMMTTVLAMASSTPTSTSTSIFTPAPATTAQVGVGSMIWSGLGGTESTSTATGTATATATTTTSNAATFTNNNATYIGQVFTGTGIEARRKAGALFWAGFGLVLSITVGRVLL